MRDIKLEKLLNSNFCRNINIILHTYQYHREDEQKRDRSELHDDGLETASRKSAENFLQEHLLNVVVAVVQNHRVTQFGHRRPSANGGGGSMMPHQCVQHCKKVTPPISKPTL